MFDIFLALDGVANGRELLEMDEFVDVVGRRETIDRVRSVFVDTANEVVHDADIERAAGLARMYTYNSAIAEPHQSGWPGQARP